MNHTAGYIQALGFAVLFMLYINGSIGWALIYAITGVVAASVISCAVSLNRFRVEVKNLSGEVANGGEAEVRITVRKTGACFLPCAAVYFEEQKLLVDMPLLFKSENTRVLRLKMPDSGLCELRPSHIWAMDFLSVVSFNAKRALAAAEPALIPVLPAYIDYDGPEVRPCALPNENEEAEDGVMSLTNGLPGCEHRPYTAGDPLRSVNYKLSAKRGVLMVRLYESGGFAETIVRTERAQPRCADVAFALSREIVGRGGSVRVVHGEGSFCANTPQTLERLREWLSRERFDGRDAAQDAPADVVISLDGQVRVSPVQ